VDTKDNKVTIKEAINLISYHSGGRKELFKSFNLSTHLYVENLLNIVKVESVTLDDNIQAMLLLSNKSTIIEMKSIPEDAYKAFQVNTNDSMFSKNNDSEDFDRDNLPTEQDITFEPLNKRVNTFQKLYQLVLSNFKHGSFEKVYHNFKTYIKFLIQTLENINNPRQLTNIFIIDDSTIVLKSLQNMITDIDKGNKEKLGILKAYDGIDALALFKIDFLLNKSIKVIITDQNMVMMNGLEMLNIIKKFRSSEDIPKLYICSADKFELASHNKIS